MHENNFEKQVQEKMESFGFDPPEAVWTNIDRSINPDKKRRRPLFWIFLFTGLLALGGGFYYTTVVHKVPAVPSLLAAIVKTNKADTNADILANQKTANYKLTEKTISPVTPNRLPARQTAQVTGKALHDIGPASKGKRSDRDFTENTLSNGAGHAVTGETEPDLPESAANIPKKNGGWSGSLVEGSGLAAGSANTSGQAGQKIQGADYQLASTDTSLAILNHSPAPEKSSVPDSVIVRETKKNTDSKKKSAWSWGLTGSTGVSAINQGLFQSSNGNATGYAGYPTASGSSGGSIVYSPSDITSGFSYSIGAFVRRSLSDRIYLSAGIDYHYYSTGIQTGNQVDSTLYLYRASASAIRVPRYYQYGKQQSYTNQYHFIEVPVSAGFQLNKNKKNPLIWEAGFTLAYLTGSNALQFNSASGAYYQDNYQLNKTQLNASTSLMFGWPLKSGALQWGPQVEYGLTQITQAGTGNPEHLLFYGLKIYFFPGNK